ncbi:restriction endonuclease subunit S [Lysinibacillus sp. NPDC048646]|uniref:restriction endonuclease subunit S n=1 Tax=Lysinibacillus sp. NPDC048646 TaxID=3390574 RepID=UPI003D064352
MIKRYRLKEIVLIVARISASNEQYFSNIKRFKCVKVPAKTIIVAKNGKSSTEKMIYQCETEVCIANDLMAIIPNESIILSEYLLYFLKWYYSTNEWENLNNLTVDLPVIEVQTKIVQLLNTVQLLMKNRDSLMTVVGDLPRHFSNISMQVENHTSQLNQGFENVHNCYNSLLHKIFKGNFFHEIHDLDSFMERMCKQ